jgi:hypothetical protein
LEENETKAAESSTNENEQSTLGDEILKLLGERTQNPGEAFVLLQQLSIYVWDQYKIDWNEHKDIPVANSRKQRCIDYISQLIDAFTHDESAT